MTATGAEARIREWAKQWADGNVEQVTEMFTADATYVSGLDGPIPDLPRAFKWASRTYNEVSLELTRVEVTEGEAFALGEVEYDFSGRRGEEPVAYTANCTFVLQKAEDDSWRIRRFHESVLASKSEA